MILGQFADSSSLWQPIPVVGSKLNDGSRSSELAGIADGASPRLVSKFDFTYIEPSCRQNVRWGVIPRRTSSPEQRGDGQDNP